jgi:hypothetical protein
MNSAYKSLTFLSEHSTPGKRGLVFAGQSD